MGKASFTHIQDEGGKIQVYLKNDLLPENVYDDIVRNLDLGDIVGVTGNLFKTKTKELTVEAHSMVLITKSLRPMPEKHKGLADIEIRYRQRYLDLMSNPESKEVFVKRSHILGSIRTTMIEAGFLEVETPMMHSVPGGALARPFSTKHNALDRELFLRIAPELHLKRLLVGGFEKVFEINRSFRNEGLSTKHNPEFTMLEFYEAFATFQGTIDFTVKIIQSASKAIGNSKKIEWDGDQINLSAFSIDLLATAFKFEPSLSRMETANALAIIPVPKMPQLIIFSYEKPIQRPEPATIAHIDIDIKPISFSLVFPSTADKPIGFRVNDEEEEMGLDTTQRGETGYNMV